MEVAGRETEKQPKDGVRLWETEGTKHSENYIQSISAWVCNSEENGCSHV